MRDWESETRDGWDAPRFACPYCWEWVAPPLEPDLVGELIWDCEVCCRPWLIRIDLSHHGERSVTVERAQN